MLETILQPDDTKERCGLILKDGSIVEIENVHEKPEEGYLMRSDAVIPFISNDMVSGTWHTHPGGDPTLSGEDYKGFLGWPDFTHHIIGVRKGETVVTCYKVEDGLVLICD